MGFGDKSKRQDQAAVLTDQALYVLKKDKPKTRVPLERLEAITLSSASFEFVVHVKGDRDLRFISYEMRSGLVQAILDLLFNVKKLCNSFPLYEVPDISLQRYTAGKADIAKKDQLLPPKNSLKVMSADEFRLKR